MSKGIKISVLLFVFVSNLRKAPHSSAAFTVQTAQCAELPLLPLLVN